MNVDERMTAYIRSLDHGEREYIRALEQEAADDGIPIIRKETEALLRVLLTMKKPKRLLEVGAAVGFSSIFMSEYAGAECKITTIENYEPRIRKARENIKNAGKQEQITLLEGDAAEILKTLTPAYDFIFMDAAKGQYIHFFPQVMRLLAEGGILVSDNVLQDGDIVQSRYAVTRRNRTIHSRMREYLWKLTHDPALETIVLPIGDGVTVSTKKEEPMNGAALP